MTFRSLNNLPGLPAYASLTQVDVALLDPAPAVYAAQASATITGGESGTARLVAGYSVDSPTTPTTLVHTADSGPATTGFTGKPGNAGTSSTNDGAGLFVATGATVTGAGLANFLLGPIEFEAAITGWDTSGDSGCGLYAVDTCTHSATFAGQVTVTYTYAVPEPTSLALFLSASGLLLGGTTWQTLRRRRAGLRAHG